MSDRPNRDRAVALIGGKPKSSSYVSVQIKGEIDENMADKVVAELRAARNASTVSVTVNSVGGDLFAAERIARAIRAHGANRKTSFARGDLMSAALLPFAAADCRRVASGTRLLLHGVAQDPGHASRWTAATYERRSTDIKAHDARVAKTLAARCGVSISTIASRMENEKQTPLIEALSIGLIHEIVGETAPLQKAWPAAVRAVLMRGGPRMTGAMACFYRPTFLKACEIGGT